MSLTYHRYQFKIKMPVGNGFHSPLQSKKMMRPYLTLTVIVWIILLDGTKGDRTFTKVYEPILGTSACFKRLNGTHEIGCRSSAKGNVGVLHLIEDEQSLQWILKDGPHAPYIALLYPEHFTRDNLNKFRDSQRVNGVLLLKKKQPTLISSFSPDSTCPNNVFGFYNRSEENYCRAWNAPATSLLFDNFDFPIFYVKNETEGTKLLDCFETFNRPTDNQARKWPLCAGQLKSFMMAARDTPTCMRRSSVISISPGANKVCDPLGDNNLWGSILPVQQNGTQNLTSKSVLVIAARFDGASLFDEISPSADTSVTGLVTILAVIKQLGLLRDELPLSATSAFQNIYFMLFNGESFGYIGSSRIVYDMVRGEFPIKLEDIKYFIELNQVALWGDSPEASYFIHQSSKSQSKELTDILESQAKQQETPLSIKTLPSGSSSWGVPPSSLHSFLRERPDLTGIVITNHQQSYKNKFYNSIFDSKESIEYKRGNSSKLSLQQKISSLASTITNSIIFLADPTSTLKAEPDLTYVDDLLHCLLENSNCSIFHAISGFNPAPGSPTDPYPLYVGVTTHSNYLTRIIQLLLCTNLGVPVENVTIEEDCWKVEGPGPNFFFNKTCWQCPTLNMTEARSPAFLIPDYDWSSGKYSTWTESVWQSFSVKIFLKPSLLHEIVTLVSGILVLIFSMFFMRFVNAKSDVIFPSRYAGYIPVPPD